MTFEIHIAPVDAKTAKKWAEALERAFRRVRPDGTPGAQPAHPPDEDWRDKCRPKFSHLWDCPATPGLACDECTDDGACRRIGQCLRFKCAFGEVEKP